VSLTDKRQAPSPKRKLACSSFSDGQTVSPVMATSPLPPELEKFGAGEDSIGDKVKAILDC